MAARRRKEDDARAEEDAKEAARRRQEDGSAEEEDKEAAKRRRLDGNLLVQTPSSLLLSIATSKGLHHSHRLRIIGDLIWCNRCGSYGQKRFKVLKDACKGEEHAKSKASQLSQLRKGCHPLTGAILPGERSAPSAKVGGKVGSKAAKAPCGRSATNSGSLVVSWFLK